MQKIALYIGSLAISLQLLTGCTKFLEVAPPISTVTTPEIFADNNLAEWAVNGIYSKMIHGMDNSFIGDAAHRTFSAGLSTILGGLSSDELLFASLGDDTYIPAALNRLSPTNLSNINHLWSSAYKTVYDCNAVLEGLSSEAAKKLRDSVRMQLTGEALTLRAFSYFYLVNFFGELPLTLTTDFNQSDKLVRSPVTKIYDQVKEDLLKAMPLLSADFSVGKAERVRANKWFAAALLARVYLYTREYDKAIAQASSVIDQAGLFYLEPDLNKVFLKNNPESIFQLKASNEHATLRNATPEGKVLAVTGGTPSPLGPSFTISPELLNAFEAGDKRKTAWMASYNTSIAPAKYKVSVTTSVLRGVQTEYYTVMRLAELYLIRAEARVLGTPANKDQAIDDLNVLRRRAGVTVLDHQLAAAEVVEAVAQERKLELCFEWGHRWLDLNRTGKASATLSTIPRKQPWLGDYQLLYPIPPDEIRYNGFLVQNPEYNGK